VFTFRGTGVEYIAEKRIWYGNADVYIDGKLKGEVSLHLENFPRLSQVVVFRIEGLPDGAHTIEIINKSNAEVNIDAFRVYGAGR
jgi:hypothetical protein